MLNEYNQNQQRIVTSFSQEVEIIKRKSDDTDQASQDSNQNENKKNKLECPLSEYDDNIIISKHAKYFK